MRLPLLLFALSGTTNALWPFSGSQEKASVVEVGATGELQAVEVSADEQAAEDGDGGGDDGLGGRADGKVSVLFRNDANTACDVFWDDGSYGVAVAHKVEAGGGEVRIDTHVGHGFYWAVHGRRQQVGKDVKIKAGVTEYVLPADSPTQVDKAACQDRHRRCPTDARNGECTRNPGWMIVNCPKSCDPINQACALLDPKKRCDRSSPHMNMSDVPTWPLSGGAVDRMFEDIMTNPAFKIYNPTALSRPPAGPWVVTFDDVIKDSEATALTATVQDKFERSTDTGASNEFGEAQKLMSSGRTSENAWCIGNCYEHPEVEALTARLEAITKVPSTHYENFQVLRYTKGQYYRTHHDMSPGDMALACGPRILTFFLYLSDVEEGGGTNFPRLDLTVQPKRGKAVLWPSVMNADPTRQDPRTHHQALPVVSGTKFAANAWIHLFDYKEPNHWGCTGAFG